MNTGTARCGVIGYPLAHTRSPELHHAFAEQCGVAQSYAVLAMSAGDFEPGVRAFFADGGLGLNVTLPYKRRALALADSASARALRAGAANVLTCRGEGAIRADNVDVTGFLRDLARRRFEARGSRACVLGAGGAAAGVTVALLEAGANKVDVLNRTPERARELVGRFGDRRVAVASVATGACDLLVNATSASLADQCPDFADALVGPGTLAYDLVYAEQPTVFMRRAVRLGARACDGWGMLVEQAAESFCLWHGVRPDTAQLHR